MSRFMRAAAIGTVAVTSVAVMAWWRKQHTTPRESAVTEPITGSLPPYEWSSEDAVAYEAAIEAINSVVGAYSALITRDPENAERYRAEQAACQQVRQSLPADDAAEIARVRATYSATMRELLGAA